MATVIVAQSILDASPAEVQAYFEQLFKVYGAEAQIVKMKARRETIGKRLKAQRTTLRGANTEILKAMRDDKVVPTEEQVATFSDNHATIRSLGRQINSAYDKKGVGNNEVKIFRDAVELYRGDCQGLALQITQWEIQPTVNLDPAILARIETLRKKKRDAAKKK